MSEKKPSRAVLDPSHPFDAIRRAGVPLVAWETSEPSLTLRSISKASASKSYTIICWDMIRGAIGMNDLGKSFVASHFPDEPNATGNNPALLLAKCADAEPKNLLVFMLGAPLWINQEPTRQALWNLRDVFKRDGSVLILIGLSIDLPTELQHDFVTISEPLPDLAAIEKITSELCTDNKLDVPAREELGKVTDALLGLSAFAAEQVLAMSITKEGINLPSLWERKKKTIEQTQGLSVFRGGESFADIGGCDNVKGFVRDILKGKRAPRAIAFIDEIEKCLAGTAGDLSGISQDYLGALLTFMQDKAATGCIFIGPPGAAKSAVAKAAGNEANIPTIQVDLGAMKGSLVGQSEKQLRQALNVIDSVSQGQTLFIATCNSFGHLPPELKRRFTLGTFFFDLPTVTERAQIWSIYQKKYGIETEAAALPFCEEGWTGAEIKQCCDIAYRLGRTLAEAAKFIVPVAKSAKEQIDSLRKQAAGKFISASYPGTYELSSTPPPPAAGRKMELN